MSDAADVSDRVLSIVICTHNRADTMTLLLADLAPQLDASVDCVVVDSASRADQADRVGAAVATVPGVRLIRMEEPGVSLARNAGIMGISSPWVALLDDDERVGPTWLSEARALLKRLPDDCGACGGNLLPIFPDGDRQLSPRWLAYLSTVDKAGEYDQTGDPRFVAGHSLLRMEAGRSVGEVDPRLGRVSNSLLSGEEVLFVHQLIQGGWKIWHSDRISVGHLIEPERLTRSWVRQRAYWEGFTVAQVQQIIHRRKPHRRIPALVAKGVALALAAAVAPRRWEADIRLAYIAGYLHRYGKIS